jgi:hypothetical protein
MKTHLDFVSGRINPFLLVVASVLAFTRFCQAEPNLRLWDTGSPLPKSERAPKNDDWRLVPTDLFKLEKDPLKSSSDPGYYGREYVFGGDMVVENKHFLAAFSSADGKVTLYSKAGEKMADITPVHSRQSIRRLNLLRNSADEVAAQVYFIAPGGADIPVFFDFGKSEIIEIKREDNESGLTIRAPVEYGVVPSFVGDDLIFDPSEEAQASTLTLPAENMALALLKGEQHQLVFTWSRGGQRVKFNLGEEKDGKRPITAIDFQTDGKSLFLAPQTAPGIWHREALSSSYLEKVVSSEWHRPFPARWQTLLTESGINTRYAFRDSASTVWRGVPGSYNYPVWFENDKAFYHLSKKVPPKGESIIYFVEGQETPDSVLTPVDILKETLGRAQAAQILDVPGRKLRTHHRRGGEGVRRACTCGCTEAIQAIFEAGQETERKEDIQQEIGDMLYFVDNHIQRINEYQKFASGMKSFLDQAWSSPSIPELKPYIENLQQIVQQIPQEYEVQKENMKDLDYAHQLESRTMQLAEKKDAGNVAAYMELLKAWRGMGGAQDYIVAQCHTLTRKLFQEASYTAAPLPKAHELALEIRQRCRDILRNADGYEIWPNY